MNLIWLVRASRWARNPPSAKQVVVVLAIIAFCLVLAGIEMFVGWPEWMRVENPRGGGYRP